MKYGELMEILENIFNNIISDSENEDEIILQNLNNDQKM